jgi:hypothetical protein
MKLIGYLYGVSQTLSKELTHGISGAGETPLSSLADPSSQAAIAAGMRTAGKPCEFDIYASWGKPSDNINMTDPQLSTDLINKVVKVVVDGKFSGSAWDWETKRDNMTRAQYTDFFRRLSAQMKPLGKTISVTENFGTVTLLPEAASYIDDICPMCYDVAPIGTWFGTLADVKADVNRWVNAGFPKSKLVVGISCAARTVAGDWGAWHNSFKYHDTPASAALKAKYVFDNQLGGVFLYHMGLDKLNDPGSIAAAVYKELFPVTPTPVPVPPPVPPPVPIPPITPSVVVSSQDIQVKDSTGKILCTITVGVK